MKHVVIFTIPKMYREISDQLLFGICDYVNCRTKHNRTVFEIDEKDIYIDIRHGDITKSAGLRPTHVLFIGCSSRFANEWEFNMRGRYERIGSMDELIEMIKEKKKMSDVWIYWKEQCKYCKNNKPCPYPENQKAMVSLENWSKENTFWGSLTLKCDYFCLDKEAYYKDNIPECNCRD